MYESLLDFDIDTARAEAKAAHAAALAGNILDVAPDQYVSMEPAPLVKIAYAQGYVAVHAPDAAILVNPSDAGAGIRAGIVVPSGRAYLTGNLFGPTIAFPDLIDRMLGQITVIAADGHGVALLEGLLAASIITSGAARRITNAQIGGGPVRQRDSPNPLLLRSIGSWLPG